MKIINQWIKMKLCCIVYIQYAIQLFVEMQSDHVIPVFNRVRRPRLLHEDSVDDADHRKAHGDFVDQEEQHKPPQTSAFSFLKASYWTL